jgi:DNA-binding NtrC family response regulator
MKTILFIDESESHRFLFSEELAENGYDVITAGNNDEVLSRKRKIKADVLILELRQKSVARESFEKLKKRYANIPWIGYSTFDRCPDDFKKQVDFYFPKSVRLDDLKVALRRVMYH